MEKIGIMASIQASVNTTQVSPLSRPTDHSPPHETSRGTSSAPGGSGGAAGEPDERQVVDLSELFSRLWARRHMLGAILAGFLLLGLVSSWTSPVEYQADVVLLPESSGEEEDASIEGVSDRITRLLGFNLPDQRRSFTGIPEPIYGDVIHSVPFLLEMIEEELTFGTLDTTLTVREYFNRWYPRGDMSGLRQAVIRARRGVSSLFTDYGSEADYYRVPADGNFWTRSDRDTVLSLSPQQKRAIAELRGRLYLSKQPLTITLRTELPDPRAAAELSRVATRTLTEYIRAYKRRQAERELAFTRTSLEDARRQYEEVQREMATYRDRNLVLSSAGSRLHMEELQARFSRAFDRYSTLFREVEDMEFRLRERTPVFSIVEWPEVPERPAKPDLKMILMVFGFLGAVASFGYGVLHRHWDVLRKARFPGDT